MSGNDRSRLLLARRVLTEWNRRLGKSHNNVGSELLGRDLSWNV